MSTSNTNNYDAANRAKIAKFSLLKIGANEPFQPLFLGMAGKVQPVFLPGELVQDGDKNRLSDTAIQTMQKLNGFLVSQGVESAKDPQTTAHNAVQWLVSVFVAGENVTIDHSKVTAKEFAPAMVTRSAVLSVENGLVARFNTANKGASHYKIALDSDLHKGALKDDLGKEVMAFQVMVNKYNTQDSVKPENWYIPSAPMLALTAIVTANHWNETKGGFAPNTPKTTDTPKTAPKTADTPKTAPKTAPAKKGLREQLSEAITAGNHALVSAVWSAMEPKVSAAGDDMKLSVFNLLEDAGFADMSSKDLPATLVSFHADMLELFGESDSDLADCEL